MTIVELLAVISIIALLVTLLIPSMKRAREQGRVSVCLANLKGVAGASLTYALGDTREQLIPIHPLTGVVLGDVGAYDWGGKSGSGEPAIPENPDSSNWDTASGRGLPGDRTGGTLTPSRRLNSTSGWSMPGGVNICRAA